MSLSDDEQIVATPYDTGMKYETLREGDIKATTIYKEEIGMEESHLSVFLEVTGAGYENERPGLDIVTVLVVNDSMKGEKLETLKSVMRILIDKLSSADRLSIVTVSKVPEKLYGLRQISIVYRAKIEELVSGLETYPGNDIDGGLNMAFKLINDRKYGTRRPAAVLLMSDGDRLQLPSNSVSFQTLPVYTIGFGDDDCSSTVLNEIAKRSNGGIYCPLNVNTSPSSLTSAFSECLTKLFTIVASDLKLTFKGAKSTVKIVNICVGTYSCSYIPFTAYDDHAVVSYGDLFANEACKVRVDLLLPRVATQQHSDLLHVFYSCRVKGEVFNSSSRLVSVTRKMDNLGMYFGNKRCNDLPDELPRVDSRNTPISSSEPDTNFKEIQSSDGQGILMKVSNSKMSKHLKQAFNYIGFQPKKEASSDLSRSQNVKASGDEIRLTYDSINVVEDIQQNVKSIPSCMTNSQDVHINEPKVEPSEEREETNDHMEYSSDRVKQAFESIQIIRGILTDYVDQYNGFQASEGGVDDQDRSQNIKALGDHIRLTFDSVKAIEDILQNVENTPSRVINLESKNIDDKLLGGQQAEPQVEPSDEHGESSDHVVYTSDRINQAFESIKIIRGLLSDYVDFQASKGALNDSKNVEALGEHIRLTFDSVKAIEDILQNAMNLEAGNINDKPLEGEQAETKVELSADNHVGHMSEQVKQAFGSVQIIREILSDYVKQHSEFEDVNGYSNNPVRSTNVKALGDHLQRAFHSVEAIEDVLIQCG